MLLPRESSQTPKQLRMKISKTKVCETFFWHFLGCDLQTATRPSLVNISSVFGRCFAAHKEKTTTNPSKDGRCRVRRKGWHCQLLIQFGTDQKHFSFLFLLFHFLVQPFLDWSPLLIVYVVCLAEEARKQGSRQRRDSESNCQPDDAQHGPHCNAAQHQRCKILQERD